MNFVEKIDNYVMAGSQTCSPQLLAELANDHSERVRLRVAENPNTPVNVLENLAGDKSADVRIAVGLNPSTSLSVRTRLTEDADPNVRLGLAHDPATPIALLEKLAVDHNPYVACMAQHTRALMSWKTRSDASVKHSFFRRMLEGLEHSELRYA